MKKHLDLSLYLVLDPGLCGGIDGMIKTTQQAIEHGVTVVQLRSGNEWKKRQWYDAAVALKQVLQPFPIPLIINDHLDIALAIDADGLHLGQNDLPVAIARQLLGKHKWLGLSVSNQYQLIHTPVNIIDYIGIGPVFPTQSKPDAAPACGLTELQQLVAMKSCPAVAIGGITSDNVIDIIATGIEGIAVVSAICGKPDPGIATQHLIKQITIGRQHH